MDPRRVFAAFLAPASFSALTLLGGCSGVGGSSMPSLGPTTSGHTSHASSPLATSATNTVVSIAQVASGNNGGGAGYQIVFPSVPNAGDVGFGGLTVSFYGNTSRTTSINNWTVLDALGKPSDTNGNLAASSYDHVIAVGESNTETVAESGGNWASGVLYDIANADTGSPIAADQWGRGNSGTVTCPAVTAPRVGSLVACEVYLDGGTADSSVLQAPTPGSGWTFDRASGSQYQEVFGFHATATTTTASQAVPAMQFTLKSDSTNWLAETVVIQPPAPTATSTPAPWPSSAVETPGMADAFVNTAGVNIHLSFYGTLYGDNFPIIASLLQGLGVRHVRDGVVLGQSNLCTEFQQLASYGIHVDGITTPGMSASTLAQWASCVGAGLEAFEGPNEYDLSGDPNWVSTLVAAQKNLYPAAKSVSPSVTVFGPALTSSSAYAAVGDLSSVEDYGNMHDYMAGRNPGNGGWGGTDQFGTYGSMTWNIGVAKQASASRTILSTESGYSDVTGVTSAVPPATKARYAMRTLLEHWLNGVPRTYFYELASVTGGSFTGFGLTDSSGNPKPAYVALQNLLKHLSDPGSRFTTTPLYYAVGASSPVHHVLLQKRNGTYQLILYVEAQEWDPVTQTAIAVTPQPVTLSFMKNPTSLTLTTFTDNGTTQTTSLAVSGGQATLTATNQVQIVDITP